ncbi:Gametolysin peptidase M11-domain-containing protein [Scenedesmus sp. NREL 46B-D3]|nr:Gametolysin peptidase M11-domain-containing protein [Scenedesmus sp. NREL 46B-D3]
MTSAALEATLFGGHDYTVEAMFSGCSLGRASFDRQHVKVLPYAVPGACSSVTNPDLSCDYEQWAQMADQWLAANDPSMLSDAKHLVYVLPRGMRTCSWGGMGWVGCSSHQGMRCRAWVVGEVADKPMVYVHELAHNLGLNHANMPQLEYGDSSDAMGLCCDVRCFNAPHLDQLGWANASAELDTATLPRNQWVTLRLPAAAAGAAIVGPYLKVSSPAELVFAQLRVKHGHDNGIPGTGVYMYNTDARISFAPTTMYGRLESTKQVFLTGSGVQIKLANDISPLDTSATLMACMGMCT